MSGNNLVLVVAALAACDGSSTSSGEDAAHGDAANGQVDGNVVDARVDAPQAPSVYGTVTVLDGTSLGVTYAVAGATLSSTAPASPTVVGTVGACTVKLVSQTSSPPAVSGGTLAITGTSSPVSIEPTGTAPSVSYYRALGYPGFAASATIAASVPGTADFPAFAITVTAPASELTGFTAPSSISRSGYAVTWTAGSGPELRIGVVARHAGASIGKDRIECIVPDTGSFTVPAGAFALLDVTDDRARVGVTRISTVTTSPVTLSVGSTMGVDFDVPLVP